MEIPQVQQVPKTVLEVAFKGDAVATGAMEVSDFAPALLGVAEACQRANAIVNGESVRLSVQIQAKIEGASVHAYLNLVTIHGLLPLIPILTHVKSAKEIASILFPALKASLT